MSGRTSYNPARLEFHHEPRLIRGLFNERRFGPPEGFAPLSSWPWLDRRVSGLPVPTRALFGLGFPAAPRLPLSLAGIDNSQAHSSIGTTSGPPGVLFTFPSRYSFAIGHWSVFSLGGWSRRLPPGFLVTRRTLSGRHASFSGYGAVALCGRPSQAVPLRIAQFLPIWAPPLSLATTDGIDSLSSPPGT